jgi:cytochrome c peroxidase
MPIFCPIMNRKPAIASLFFLGFLAALQMGSCRPEQADILPEYDPTPYVLDIGDFPPPPPVPDNPLTRAGVQLGRMLFYERALSADGTQACADCHRQTDGFSDPRAFSIGVAGLPGTRHSMALFNLAWHRNGFFWDGRSPSLRHQALQPIQDPLEMNEELVNAVRKLGERRAYRHQFVRAFGDEQITEARIGLALEQFMRVLVSRNSKYDRYLRGQATLTPSEERGRLLYFGEYDPQGVGKGAECFHCHGGFNLTNDQYMNNGLDTDGGFTDPGLFAVTGKAQDMARFKVPSLRNIAVTAPYMHDGRFATLEEAIQHYNTGVKPSSTIDFLLHYNLNPGGLRLDDQDMADLLAFLHTFTDPAFLQDTAFARPF